MTTFDSTTTSAAAASGAPAIASPRTEASGADQRQQKQQRPYVKPVLTQLHYMVDQHVSLSASCKTTGATTGPTIGDCMSGTINVPCAGLGS